MSLVVRLPLNGDIKNIGAAKCTTTVYKATVSTEGKIGSCYQFNNSDSYIALNSRELNDCFRGGSYPFTVCCWIYHADSSRAIIFGDYNLPGTTGVNIELKTDHTVRFWWDGSPDITFSNGVGASTWSHVAITYNGTQIKYYLNGVLKQTNTNTLSANSKTTGDFRLGADSRTGTTVLNGRLNDFRVYDECLSAEQVADISKGLVIHYPLDQGDKHKNLISGDYECFSTFTYFKESGSLTLNGITASDILNNKGRKLCLSCNMYSVGSHTATATDYRKDRFGCHGTLNYVDTNNTTKNAYPFTDLFTLGKSEGRYVSTWTIPSDIKSVNYFTIGLQDNWKSGYAHPDSSNSNVWYIRNYQLEWDFATEYTPHTTSSKFQGYEEKDISGYFRNGAYASANNVPTYQNNQVINRGCYKFDGSNDYMIADSLPTTVQTISIWAYVTSIPTANGVLFADKNTKMALGWYPGGSGLIISCDNLQKPIQLRGSLVNLNAWNNFVVTRNGDTFALYINGTKCSTTSQNYWTHIASKLYIGARDSSGTPQLFVDNALSDFKAWATLLTDAEIQNIYTSVMGG